MPRDAGEEGEKSWQHPYCQDMGLMMEAMGTPELEPVTPKPKKPRAH